jgi:hypothetical protein
MINLLFHVSASQEKRHDAYYAIDVPSSKNGSQPRARSAIKKRPAASIQKSPIVDG